MLRVGVLLVLMLFGICGAFLAVIVATQAGQHDALVLDLAGQQRMQSERYTRQVHRALVSGSLGDRENWLRHRQASEATAERFEHNLAALRDGGRVHSHVIEDGLLRLPGFRDPVVRAALDAVAEHWSDLRELTAAALDVQDTLNSGEGANAEALADIEQHTEVLIAAIANAIRLIGAHSNTRLARVIALGLGGIALAVLLVAASILFVDRRIARPLQHLVREQSRSNRRLSRALDELRAYQTALDQHAIVAVTDRSGRILRANDLFCRISGYPAEELVGQNHRIVNSGYHPRSFWAEMWRVIASGGVWHGEVCNRARDGHLYWVETTIFPIQDRNGRIHRFAAIRTDITERKQREQRLYRAATTDALTGLPNRGCFTERLAQALAAARESGEGFAVLFLDFDGFKQVNDSLGHAAGDLLLQAIAGRLQGCLRGHGRPGMAHAGDSLVARLAGDEFVVLLESLRDPADAGRVAQRLLAVLAEPYDIEGQRLGMTASIGIVTHASSPGCVDRAMRYADLAMYEAKRRGRNRWMFFEAWMAAGANVEGARDGDAA